MPWHGGSFPRPDDPQRTTLGGSRQHSSGILYSGSRGECARARLEVLARVAARRAVVRSRRRLLRGLAVKPATPAPVAPLVPVVVEQRGFDESGVALPAVGGDDGCTQTLILTDETLSGIETPGVEYGHAAECAPAPAVVAAPVAAMPREPASPHELRGRKLRLLEELTDRIVRRKRGV